MWDAQDDFLLTIEQSNQKFKKVFQQDEEHWNTLTTYLDNNNWKLVGEKLGFTSQELQHLQTNFNSPSKELLSKWNEKTNGSVALLESALGTDYTAKNILHDIINQQPSDTSSSSEFRTTPKNSFKKWKSQWTCIGILLCILLLLLSPAIITFFVLMFTFTETMLIIQTGIIVLIFFGWLIHSTWTVWRMTSHLTEASFKIDLEYLLDNSDEKTALKLCKNAHSILCIHNEFSSETRNNMPTPTTTEQETKGQNISVSKQDNLDTVIPLDDLSEQGQRQQFREFLRTMAQKSETKRWVKLSDELRAWDIELEQQLAA